MLSCLVINDVDAGAGVFRSTQNTVNSQMVVGTLMNICDHPDRVCVGTETYRADEKPLRRVPIVVTGNDLSTLYAPLLRDGRMDKFLWARRSWLRSLRPCFPISTTSPAAARRLVAAFPKQRSLDFFGAVHARTVDDAVLRVDARRRGRSSRSPRRSRKSWTPRASASASAAARKPDWSRVYGARADAAPTACVS